MDLFTPKSLLREKGEGDNGAPRTRFDMRDSPHLASMLMWTSPSPSDLSTTPIARREPCKAMKTPTACAQCRKGKRRCTIGDNGGSCNECLRRRASCSLVAKASSSLSGKRPILPHNTYSNSEDLVLDLNVRVRLGRLYIALIHDKPHTLFHPPTFMRQLENGSIPAKVMYGVFAMAARYNRRFFYLTKTLANDT